MKLVKLSIGNGRHIWVNPDRVRSIWAGVGVYEGKTMVDSGDADGPTCIHGTPDEVAAALTGEAPASGLLKGLDVETFAADVVAAIERAAAGLDEAPVESPAKAEREMLPLWEQDRDGDWSRGQWLSSSVWVESVGGEFRGHTDGAHSFRRDTAEGAMAHADMLASEAGYALPWDSMVPDPSLVAVLAGKRFHVVRSVNEIIGVEPATSESVTLWRRIPANGRESARSDAFAVLARLLRAHGAIVTEAA